MLTLWRIPARVRQYFVIALVLLSAVAGARAEPLLPSAQRILLVVAHQDDDILVTVPDLVRAVKERRSLRTIYLTSGDAGFTCNAYTQARERGAKAQQARLAGVPNRWVDEERTVAGKQVRFSSLVGTSQSLAFLALPNAALLSREPPEGALMKLWRHEIREVATLPYDGRTRIDRYTREQLIDVMHALMVEFQPDDVRLLDASQQQLPFYPFEHVDHMASAMFGFAAVQRFARVQSLTFYPLYSMQFSPRNLAPAEASLRRTLFAAYKPLDAKLCATGLTRICGGLTTCDPSFVYEPFFERHYPVDTLSARGVRLRAPGGSCLDHAAHAALRLSACESKRPTQRWSLERGGIVRNQATGQCLYAASGRVGQVVSTRACTGGVAEQFYLTTQGQLRGPEATCVRGHGAQAVLAACAVDARQRGWKRW